MSFKKIALKTLLWVFITLIATLLLAVGTLFIFKDKIIQATVAEVNKTLNTKIDIDPKIELSLFEKFPQVAIGFKNIKVYESIPNSKNLLGKADELYLTFNFWNILDGHYIINKVYLENGDFYLHVDKNGNNNYTILKKDTSSTTSGSGGIDLSEIYIKNVLVKYLNESNEQYYEVLSHELKAGLSLANDNYLINLTGPQLVNTIRVHDGEYFKGKEITINSSLQYNDSLKFFRILPTTIQVEKSDFQIDGTYDFKDQNKIDLKIENKNGTLYTLLSLLPKSVIKNFSAYKSEGEIYFNATIKGIISEKENAAINVEFGCKKAAFFHPDLNKKISDANFYGSFSNGANKDASTSSLKLENMRFDFDEKMIQGSFWYQNFSNPYVAFDATGELNIASILAFYPIKEIASASGTIEFDVEFKGLLEDLKTREGHNKIETSGEITIKELACKPANAKGTIQHANGTFLFNKNDVAVTNLTTEIGNSSFKLNGIIKNLIGAMLLENGKMLADLRIASSRIDVEELLSFIPTSSDTSTTTKKGNFPYLEKYAGVFELDLESIQYKKISVRNFKGSIRFDQPLMKADNISFQLAEGSIALNSNLNFHSEKKIETTIRSTLKSIQIDSLLYMFDNFGQSFITFKNLKGEFNGTIETAFDWNSGGTINTKSLVASIDGSILKGELVDFEPMQSLSKFIDAQELAHIKFAELKNKVYIENEKISFPEMQIISNVSDISFSGSHSFENYMDYRLAVPLKNIKKPKIDKDASFGAIEEDSKKGSTVFLLIKGTPENYKISYDTKRTKNKIQEDLKKEKQEFKNLFKKKEEELQQTVKPNTEEFFEFD